MTNIKLRNFALRQQKAFGEDQLPLDKLKPLVVTPTGCVALDWALRAGGWIRGRGYEIVGVKDSGKSTLVLTSAGIHQKLFPDRGVAYIDVEKTFEKGWAAELGVDCSKRAYREGRWLHYFPKNSEAASDMAREAAASGEVSLIIVDSIGGMESKKALEKDAEKSQVGSNAQVITRMSKHLATLCRDNDVVLLLVNQYRANLDNPMGADISAGPKAMQHMTTSKIEMAQVFARESTRKATFWDAEEVVGNMSRAKVTRLKTGARSRVAEFWINTQATVATEEGPGFGPVGIDEADDYLQIGLKVSAITQEAGGYYVIPGLAERVRGKDNVLRILREKPEIRDAIRAEIPFEPPVDELEDDDA